MIFFKFPFNQKIYKTDKNLSENFVGFFSFNNSEQIDFQGNIIEINRKEMEDNSVFSDELERNLVNLKEENESDYILKLQKVIDFIKENKLQKLVISRRKLLNYNNLENSKKINLSLTFLSLCENYENAFVYFFIKNGKCWIGAFSEILGRFNKKTSEFETMSLAGTLPVKENWTKKEIEEQKPVSDYIKNILTQFSDKVEKSTTYDHISGNIKHLRTDFKTKINRENLDNIIAELHPTPAVCGIPKDFCKRAIEDFENYPRELYAGYIKIETEEYIQYFVNLRCAQFMENIALIYVGGGITEQSSPEKEWQETELKSEAILKNLVFS